MLRELSIKNLAIIDELTTSFTEGLNVISGETGAGKSIIMGALSLLLGERASNDLIRSSEKSAEVEALFDIEEENGIRERLDSMGLYDGNELHMKRTVSRSGKNRVYINGSPATLGMLSSLSGFLVNICGQHEHQVILDADNHIDILDEFGALLPLRTEYSDLYNEYQALLRRLEELKTANREKGEREELLRFQLKEIQESGLRIGEDAELQSEKKILINAQKLKEYAEEAYDILYGREGSVLEGFVQTVKNLKEIKTIDSGLAVSDEEMESAEFGLEEIAYALRDYKKGIDFNPERLEEIDDRLEYLGRLKRKYGGEIGHILEKERDIEEELGLISSMEEEIGRASEEISEKQEIVLSKAAELSRERRNAARLLEEQVEREIHSMMMNNTGFEVRFLQSPEESDVSYLNPKGIDALEFYLSTNIGEDMKPLNKIASGGELSRIVLAMKKVLATTASVGTVVFDEVDSGIGGAAAEAVGEKLRDVSTHHQVICITHLPQIACFGTTHFLVSKEVSKGRTNTCINFLDESERVDEITRMLGGLEITEKTREHAREMLKASQIK
ncbi:MAG: DNA repair protein RecN [Deltaproteobacteria bacterium]|nr:DNA repair protein RecN [Deltaproteobacteria bacterium]MBN2844712.1 DNA repair protein RecN [Deltaproteobacteria bacterium]